MIYHGTPLTPRAALNALLPGRAACVSFWRPDDAEAVEAVASAIMFRQWSLFRMAGSAKARRGMVHPRRLDALFRVAGAAPYYGPVGSRPGRSWSAQPDQRRAAERLAVRPGYGLAAVAHGPACRAPVAAVRAVFARLSWLDRRGQALGPAGLSRPHGGGGPGARQPLAGASHDARDRRRWNVSVRVGGRDHARTKRVAL